MVVVSVTPSGKSPSYKAARRRESDPRIGDYHRCDIGRALEKRNRRQSANVISQTSEDGLGDTVRPRLVQTSANCPCVLVYRQERQGIDFQRRIY